MKQIHGLSHTDEEKKNVKIFTLRPHFISEIVPRLFTKYLSFVNKTESV